MIVCVTGKIGSGKSSVALFFKSKGFIYINVDELGHKAFEKNIEVIKKEFGTENRKEIGKIVFSDYEKLKKLEKIVHPTLKELINEALRSNKGKDIVIEAAIKRRLNINCCDLTITVVANSEIVKGRLKERYSSELIEEIFKRQEDVIEEGIVIYNNGTYEELEQNLVLLWNSIIKQRWDSHKLR